MLSDSNMTELTERLSSYSNSLNPFNISLAVVGSNGETADNFSVGDAVKIRFESSCDGYLTLLDIGTSGNINIIMPHFLNIDNFVRAGRAIYLPDGDNNVAAIVQSPTGVERLKAFFTKNPLNLFDVNFNSLSPDSFSLSDYNIERKYLHLTKLLSNESKESWNETLYEFLIH